MIPAMLKLIQNQKQEIDYLKKNQMEQSSRILILEEKMSELLKKQ